jgi:hypothetical protein
MEARPTCLATRRAALLALALVPMLPAAPALAAVDPPTTLALHDASTLPLAACAARDVLLMDGYTVSLYLPEQARPLASAIAAPLPKAVRIDVQWRGPLPERLPGRWEQRLRQGVAPDVFRGVQELYARLSHGDSVLFAHAPGRGTAVTVNGRRVLAAPDASLVDTLLDMFVGPEPVSRTTKQRLLQPGC